MSVDVKRAEYFDATIDGHSKEASKLLSTFATAGVSLLAFKAVPAEAGKVRFSLFPNDRSRMIAGGAKAGLPLDGPRAALLIQGDDESGALSEIYRKLSLANIVVRESCGIANINGSYGVVLYLDPGDCERAIAALSVGSSSDVTGSDK